MEGRQVDGLPNFTNVSRIRDLHDQIDAEARSAWLGLHGSAVTSQHRFINARYEKLGKLQGELSEFIGEPASMDVLIESLDWFSVLGSDQRGQVRGNHPIR